MSANSEAPPTYYFSGITFNPDFYQSTSGEYLTASTGRSYFLSYPTAQGEETISTLITPSILSTSDDTNMTIGSNLTTGALSLASAQTTGTLNIGSNTTATRTTGAINIGSNNSGTCAITIGTAGKTTTSLNGTNVTIASKLTA